MSNYNIVVDNNEDRAFYNINFSCTPNIGEIVIWDGQMKYIKKIVHEFSGLMTSGRATVYIDDLEE